MGVNVARPPDHGNYNGAAVAVDCHRSGRSGQIQISRGVRGTHRCIGHPYKGALYYSLHTVGKLPAELHLALKMHLREHHGDLALLAPHGLATDPPQGTKTKPRV